MGKPHANQPPAKTPDPGMSLDEPSPAAEEQQSQTTHAGEGEAEAAEPQEQFVRVTDETRPHCPRCSNENQGKIQFLDSQGTSGPVTYYKCPECGFSQNKIRKTARQLLKMRSNPLDLSAR